TSLCLDFEALARRGGSAIADPGDPHDSLVIWLDAVKKQTARPGMSGGSGEWAIDGVSHGMHESAEIPGVSEASANLCRILESKALEKERFQTVRDEPHAVDRRASSHPKPRFPKRAEWLR